MDNIKREKIKFEKLSKTYITQQGHELHVLKNINGIIYDNDFVSLIGPSGCGKTTLLQIVAGLIPPSNGKILLDGREVKGPGRDRGVIFQQEAIFMWRRVIEMVEYGLEMRGIKKDDRREISRKYLRLVGLDKFSEFYPKELSGGMKKRVAIATVFANNPEVLLMDEPFGSLDYVTKIGLQSELLKIWEHQRKTTIFVTHDIEESIFLSDRILVLKDGHFVEDVEIHFKRPRKDDLRLSAEFQAIKMKFWQYLK